MQGRFVVPSPAWAVQVLPSNNYYDARNITIHYDGGTGGHDYDVLVVYNVSADVPHFVMTEPSPTLYYKFNLITSLACI